MDGLEAGVQTKIFHHQMARASDATGAGIRDGLLPCRGCLCVGDEFRHRVDRNGRMHNQHVAGGGEDSDRSDVLVRIEGQLAVEAGIYCERCAEHDPERMAIGGCSSDDFGSDVTARAWPILDHEWLL